MTITSDVIEHLENNLDVTLKISDIADALGYRKSQVSASIFNKRHYDKEFKNRIRIPSSGLVLYKSYNSLIDEAKASAFNEIKTEQPKKSNISTNNMYEQIGITKTGDLVLQDEDGNLFRATELT